MTCLRWHSLLGAQLVQGNPVLWPLGLDHSVVPTAPRTTVEIKEQTFTPISRCVLGRKISGKRSYYRIFRGYEEEYRWKGEKADERDLEWDFETYQKKMRHVAAPQFTWVSVLVFRIFPREYLLQQIHLYSLADLQQVSTQRGRFISAPSLGRCLCWLWSWHWIQPPWGSFLSSPDNWLISLQNGKKLSIKRYSRTITTVGKDAEKSELSPVAGGNVKWYSLRGKPVWRPLEEFSSYHVGQQVYSYTYTNRTENTCPL